jgi:hypothetical protein
MQQDVTTCHAARTAMDMLKTFFRDRTILKGIWPPRSLDLISVDCFYGVFLQNACTRTLQETYNN